MATSQLTAPVLQALQDGALAGNWTLDPAGSQVRLRSRSLWGMVSVKGVFGQVAGAGVITRGGEVSGTLTVGAEVADQGVELGLVAGDEGDVEAAGPEGAGDGQAHPGASADDGDDRHVRFLLW